MKKDTIIEVEHLSKTFQKKIKMPGVKGFFNPIIEDQGSRMPH